MRRAELFAIGVAQMASESSSTFKRLKALAKAVPDVSRIRGLLRVIEHRNLGSDYAVAIIGASIIERALEAAILARLVPHNADERNKLFNFDQKGILADLAARNRMGYALGLYGKRTLHDLEKIRHVRNLFAHSKGLLGFDEKAIAEACADFNIVEFIFALEAKTAPKDPPKTNYVTACLAIAGRLGARAEENEEIEFPRTDGIFP